VSDALKGIQGYVDPEELAREKAEKEAEQRARELEFNTRLNMLRGTGNR
jgi:hypothetical protein